MMAAWACVLVEGWRVGGGRVWVCVGVRVEKMCASFFFKIFFFSSTFLLFLPDLRLSPHSLPLPRSLLQMDFGVSKAFGLPIELMEIPKTPDAFREEFGMCPRLPRHLTPH